MPAKTKADRGDGSNGFQLNPLLVLWGVLTMVFLAYTINHIGEESRIARAGGKTYFAMTAVLCTATLASALTTALCLMLPERAVSAFVFVLSLSILLAILSLDFVISHCPHGCNFSPWLMPTLHAMSLALGYSAIASGVAWLGKKA